MEVIGLLDFLREERHPGESAWLRAYYLPDKRKFAFAFSFVWICGIWGKMKLRGRK